MADDAVASAQGLLSVGGTSGCCHERCRVRYSFAGRVDSTMCT